MELRQNPRFPLLCPISFAGDNITGTGTVMNVSLGGWKIVGNQDVPQGAYLEMRVGLPDNDPPMKVELAVVRWSKGREFGAEYLRMDADQKKRLRQFVQTLQGGPSP
ncbi:MAG: PilZ domain-containing protein [Nitrospiraceae bacterium]